MEMSWIANTVRDKIDDTVHIRTNRNVGDTVRHVAQQAVMYKIYRHPYEPYVMMLRALDEETK